MKPGLNLVNVQAFLGQPMEYFDERQSAAIAAQAIIPPLTVDSTVRAARHLLIVLDNVP